MSEEFERYASLLMVFSGVLFYLYELYKLLFKPEVKNLTNKRRNQQLGIVLAGLLLFIGASYLALTDLNWWIWLTD